MRFNSKILLLSMTAMGLSWGLGFATTNQPVSVSGNVIANCNTLTSPNGITLAFGSYSPFGAADLTAGPLTFSINCARGNSSFSIVVDGGLNAASANPSGDRAMKDGNGSFLTYQLYQTSGTGSPWQIGTAYPQTTGGENTANSFSLYGIIPHGQLGAEASNSYSDTVKVTVNY
ncbi:MAG: Csu type fimbrial protein [Vulcanimicrobiaceae bacterium]